MSQEFFARCLRVPGRTLEKWEQGTSRPTGAGASLLWLVERHPDLAMELAVAA
jgi:DNA-binding transcriptional regulator YiaG